MGGDFELIKALREEIAAGALPGPQIVAAGPQLTGASKNSSQELASNSEESGRRAAISLKQTGVDFIKVQSSLPVTRISRLLARQNGRGSHLLVMFRS